MIVVDLGHRVAHIHHVNEPPESGSGPPLTDQDELALDPEGAGVRR